MRSDISGQKGCCVDPFKYRRKIWGNLNHVDRNNLQGFKDDTGTLKGCENAD